MTSIPIVLRDGRASSSTFASYEYGDKYASMPSSRLPFGDSSTASSVPTDIDVERGFRSPATMPRYLPPALPGPPAGPPPVGLLPAVIVPRAPPTINPGRELEVGDVVAPTAIDDDMRYRVRARIGVTHFGRVFIADVLVNQGTVATGQEVVLKEFRADSTRVDRLQGRTRAAKIESLRDIVETELDASRLINARLSRPESARFNGPWTNPRLSFLLTLSDLNVVLPGGVRAFYLVSQYVVGSHDLHDFARLVLFPLWRAGRDGRYKLLALTIARTLMRALAAMHAAGILHRDVKPSNTVVFWDPADDPTSAATFLIDFGHLCAFSDPLRPLALDPPEINFARLRCDVPYSSTPGYLDPGVQASRRNLDTLERFTVTKAADVYAAAQTIRLLFDPLAPTLNPTRYGVITAGTSAMPAGLLPLLTAMTHVRLDERISAADAVHGLERIIDRVDAARTVLPPVAPPGAIIQGVPLSDASTTSLSEVTE